ncbi:MAG: hypothetical protein MJZ16_06390 [Bacteroidales bacterium]|nr:hypothetical protein [Bacteroidales bacterium]
MKNITAKPIITLLCFTLVSTLPLSAQHKKDTTDATSSNSAIFLNAASDSKPREISLGLPTNTSSAVPIFEDGMPVTYYIYQMFPYKSWHGGVSARSTSTIGPMETAMRYGEINNYVDSYNKGGSETFKGSVSYVVGQWGQHKLDINVTGPIARGWGYSLSTYQNFDPGSNHTINPMLKDRHQFYKGVLSKDFLNGRGGMALTYQYVNFMNIQETYGPFVFVGDGSVKMYNGFDLGYDSYRPDIATFTFMDFKTGEMREMGIKEGNTDKTHHLTYTLDYDLGNGVHLDFRSRLRGGTSVRGAGSLSGIENVAESAGYTYRDGTPFSGYLQRRMILHFDAFDTSWMNNAEVQFSRGNHSLRIGADYHFTHGGTTSSSVNFAHSVEADPAIIARNGEIYSNFNSAGEYYDGFENKVAGYVYDEWKPFSKMSLTGFLRAEYLNIHGQSANNIGDDKSNTRYNGFNLTKGKITHFGENYLNGSFGLNVNYVIVGNLAFQADGIFTRVHSNIFNYGGFYDPSTDPTDTKFVRAGISYKNDWVNVVSQVNYINQSNYNTRSIFQHSLTRPVGDLPVGYNESLTLPVTYGIASLGWVTDAMLTPFKGFTLHLQYTLREPKYRNFEFTPTFSDGVTEEYDFSGNNVTNLHKMEIVVDPSYSYGAWRWWLSTRYISKTYINKTNSLFFKGRLETFGGIDYRLSSKCKVSLNVINILNQKGASGLISSADLVTDASGFKDYLMSGTFIRPFTIELGINLDF